MSGISGMYENTKGARMHKLSEQIQEVKTSKSLIRMENDNAVLMPSASAMLAEFERQVKEIEEKQKELKKRILAEMEANGILSLETDELSITYVAPYPKESFDSKAFRKKNPDLYDEYVKISNVSASVRLKVKNNG